MSRAGNNLRFGCPVVNGDMPGIFGSSIRAKTTQMDEKDRPFERLFLPYSGHRLFKGAFLDMGEEPAVTKSRRYAASDGTKRRAKGG